MKALLLVLLCASPALAQFTAFIPIQDEDYEADNGLMSPSSALVLYYSSEGPMSFVAIKPKDLPANAKRMGRVYGRACQYGIGIPLTPPTSATGGGASISAVVGNGSYNKAFADMSKRHPEVSGVFDVMVDNHFLYLFTIFRRVCTEVTAQGFSVPTPDAAPQK